MGESEEPAAAPDEMFRPVWYDPSDAFEAAVAAADLREQRLASFSSSPVPEQALRRITSLPSRQAAPSLPASEQKRPASLRLDPATKRTAVRRRASDADVATGSDTLAEPVTRQARPEDETPTSSSQGTVEFTDSWVRARRLSRRSSGAPSVDLLPAVEGGAPGPGPSGCAGRRPVKPPPIETSRHSEDAAGRGDREAGESRPQGAPPLGVDVFAVPRGQQRSSEDITAAEQGGGSAASVVSWRRPAPACGHPHSDCCLE